MSLTQEEVDVLEGRSGSIAQQALRYQIEVGEFFGAKRLVPASHALVTADYEVLNAAGLAYLEDVRDQNPEFRIPVARNAGCVDASLAGRLQQRQELVEGERRVVSVLRSMGVELRDTCIPYQTAYEPKLGEHVAWGDTGAVAYANAVLGARSNFEAGPSSLFAAITGKVPAYGFHLDEMRMPTYRCRVTARMQDAAEWGVLGKLLGERRRGYWSVPFIELEVDFEPSVIGLKQLAASIASYGSCAMFHVRGVTPESELAAGHASGLVDVIEVTQQDVDAILNKKPTNESVDLVVFTAPQLGADEVKEIADYFADRELAVGVNLIITTDEATVRVAQQSGHMDVLRRKEGVMVIVGTCWYCMEPQDMAERFRWNRIVTNSAKLANIMKAYESEVCLRRTDECLSAAATGAMS